MSEFEYAIEFISGGTKLITPVLPGDEEGAQKVADSLLGGSDEESDQYDSYRIIRRPVGEWEEYNGN